MNPSKTPQFDRQLDAIIAELKPHTRKCIQSDISKYCDGEFFIEETDILFYKMLRVPPPRTCPTCRRQKRFAFVNRSSFYKRKNEAPEGPAFIVSYVPPKSPLIVYDYEYYRSANWDPITYGVDYDFGKTFFSQLYDLRLRVPQPSIIKDPSNINYEYSLNGRNSKNVYCSSGAFSSEDVWYSVFVSKSRMVMDSHKASHHTNCYKAYFSSNCTNCQYMHFSKECIDSRFMYDCRNCQDCFGCVNLRNKKYCFFNEQLDKEAYNAKIQELNLDTRSSIEYIKEKFWDFVKSKPVLGDRSTQSIDSEGVLLTNCRNCTSCVSVERAENERYCDSTIGHRDSMDVYTSGGSELLYQCTGSGSDCANSKFLVNSKFITDSEYMFNCRSCQFCFGCIGLENKKYCIFNKQYEPNDYFEIVDKIKSTMLTSGEYGEFFPYQFSTFAYNGSDVDYIYPLEESEIKKIGALYQDNIDTDLTGLVVVTANELPDSITDVTDQILEQAIVCEETGKPFRIIKSELSFYRRNSIPLPTVHPYRRIKNMFVYMGNNLSYADVCKSCGVEIQTIYIPNTGWKVYCKKCFQQEVV